MPNSVSRGASYDDPSFTTLNVTGATTLDGNVAIGNATGDLVAFHGATAVAQAAVITVITTGVTAGFANSADFLTFTTGINAIRTLLINKGLMAAS